MSKIESSELIINPDGSVFHLHLKPGQIADKIILVGDPGRVELIADMFSKVEHRASNREMVTATGEYKGVRMSVISTGIGTDNIDIVVTELDALVNVDFESRSIKDEKTQLTLVRLGTSGALQPNIELGTNILAETSAGFDGLLNFYAGRDSVCDLELESAFTRHMGWNPLLAKPYFVNSSLELNSAFRDFTTGGITISSPGFYGPQGRVVRLPLADPAINAKLEAFRHNGRRIMNYEMESSALAGLSALLGHRATTICTIIAQRVNKQANPDYRPFVVKMIESALDRLAGI